MRSLGTIPARQRGSTPRGPRNRHPHTRMSCAARRIVIAPPSPIGAFARLGGMGRNSRHGALAVAERKPGVANPRLEITPSLAQYEQLCRDLKKLRKLGAPSHTAAIVSAVHAAAAGKFGGGRHEIAGQR